MVFFSINSPLSAQVNVSLTATQGEIMDNDSAYYLKSIVSNLPDSSRFVIFEFIDGESNIITTTLRFDLVSTHLSTPGTSFIKNSDGTFIFSFGKHNKYALNQSCLFTIEDKYGQMLEAHTYAITR